jgi:hypothetical protein
VGCVDGLRLRRTPLPEVHAEHHEGPDGEELRLPFLKERLVSTVFDEVEGRLFVADGHRAVGSWARW